MRQIKPREDKMMPSSEAQVKPLPDALLAEKPLPDPTDRPKAIPEAGSKENFVTLDGEEKEIKPTRLYYHRQKITSFEKFVAVVPLTELVAADIGVVDETRDGDKCLFDWLVACFDDVDYVSRHYDNITASDVKKIHEIFRRVNGMENKNDSKNAETKGTNR